VLIADVLSIKVNNKPILPVPIQSNLPHIHLKVGPADCEHDPIELCCLVDSAASLTNGNSYYCSNIAKAYPHLVHSVLTSDSFSLIVMSGIVHANGLAVTMELPVAFVFYLPYLTLTLRVATGPHTGVNIILGMPFAESTGMILDFADNVADCKTFPLFKKRARVQVPFSGNSTYDTFITDIDDLECQMDSVYRCVHHVPLRNKIEPSSSTVSFKDPLEVVLQPTKGTAMQCGTAILQPEVYRADVNAKCDDGSWGSHDSK
jgi:hypothetical protein